jgi:hypothetical protein
MFRRVLRRGKTETVKKRLIFRLLQKWQSVGAVVSF